MIVAADSVSVRESPETPRGNGLSVQAQPTPVEDVLASAYARWSGAAERFELSAAASEVVQLLLRCDLDLAARSAVLGDDQQTVGIPRAHVLASLSPSSGASDALAAVSELEERGVVTAREGRGGWMANELLLAPEVRAYCLKQRETAPQAGPPQCARLEASISHIASLSDSARSKALVVIRGGRGSGRDALLKRLLSRCSIEAWVRSALDLRGPNESLEPTLSGRVAVWDARGIDVGPEDQERAERYLDSSANLAVALLDSDQDAPVCADRTLYLLRADLEGALERTECWLRLLEGCTLSPAEVDAAAASLASRNAAGAGTVARSAQAILTATWESPETLVSAVEQCLAQLMQPSNTRGLVVEHPDADADWSRLVVSAPVGRALNHVFVLARTSGAIGRERRGVKALFSGASGTGKTLASRAIARALGKPLFRVDLASMVSKWLGETEKNLRHAFEAAGSAGAVLLFDEGDALFAKRGEVEKGSDRYANVEASYLLQALEAHEGLVLVTTNAKHQIDRAFLRRFDVAVEFHAPMASERIALWQRELGEAGCDLNDAFLRRFSQVDLTGGNIAAASRLARALAWERGDARVTEGDVSRAVEGELNKVGASATAARWANSDK